MRNRNQPACRNRNHLSGGCLTPVIACVVIASPVLVALIPLRIWHVIWSGGKQHPDTATWIAYGICGTLILAALMAGSIRASRNGEWR